MDEIYDDDRQNRAAFVAQWNILRSKNQMSIISGEWQELVSASPVMLRRVKEFDTLIASGRRGNIAVTPPSTESVLKFSDIEHAVHALIQSE